MRAAIALLAACVLAGCSAGSSTTTPVAPKAKGKAPARFTISVPSSAGTSSKLRAPQYISAATKSVIVTLTQVSGTAYIGYTDAVNLTTSSPACSGTPLTCTVTISVPIGSDTFTVATYDAPQTSTNPTTPAGNLLSQASLSLTVTANGPNAASLVLGGVPVSLSATPSGPVAPPAGANYLQGNVGGLLLWGSIAQTVTINALDAGGQTIIGQGAPTYTLTSPSGTLTASSVSSNVFALQATTSGSPAVVTPGTVNLTATATPAAGTGTSPVTAGIPVTINHSIVYVCTGTTGTSVEEFYDGATTASVAISNGLNGPRGVAVDSSGTLYVANHGNSTIVEYAGGSTTPTTTLSTGVSSPEGVAVDLSDNLWVGNSGNDALLEFQPGQTSPTTTIPTGLPKLRGVSFDSSGDLWTVDQQDNVVEEFVPPLTSSSTYNLQIITGIDAPIGVADDAPGDVWVGNSASASVTETTPPFTLAPTVLLQGQFNNPQGVAVDAGGTVWVADTGLNEVFECLPPYSTCTAVLNAVNGIDGALWIAVTPGAVVP